MTSASLLGVLILDRDPYVFADFLGLFQAWLQDAGGFAFVGLIAYILYAIRMPPEQAASAKDRAGVSPFMLAMLVLSLLFFVLTIVLLIAGKGEDFTNARPFVSDPGSYVKYVPPKFSLNLRPITLMLGGLFALLGVGEPFARSLAKIKWRRLWALSILSFREAVRNRLFWIFLLILVPAFFPAKWFAPVKPEDELRSTLSITSAFMNVILLVPAALLAAFSIPNDIKNQNLYTVVTKPVERFEVVLGRFIGYSGLMTIALAAVMLVSWAFIRSAGIDESARKESFKARMPLRGTMAFQSRKVDFSGTDVGREFNYRKYIAGDPTSPQRAVWSFDKLPAALGRVADPNTAAVPVEFTFDIYRMTKGVENRGVDLTIRVVTHNAGQVPPVDPKDSTWKWADAAKEREYAAESSRLARQVRGLREGEDVNAEAVFAAAAPGGPGWKELNELTEKFGYYELTGKEIADFRPAGIEVPAGLFKNALASSPAPDPKDPKAKPALLKIYVKCTTAGQMLGMAEGDLFVLEGERGFDQNYFKSAIGLWCRILILIGIAVVLSTYLAAVVALLGSLLLFVLGYFTEHISDVASGQSYAGGPFKAITSLLKAEQPTAQPDANSLVTGAVATADQFNAWGFRRVINMIPDVEGFSWTSYVKEGFDVPAECLVMNVIVTVGYLLPWFVLGYYLMRSREVAE